MNLSDLILNFQQISDELDKQFPMTDRDKRVFARITKMVEEFGERADASLFRANLQRDGKWRADVEQQVADEFADVLSTLILRGIELDIDIEKAITLNLQKTSERLHITEVIA